MPSVTVIGAWPKVSRLGVVFTLRYTAGQCEALLGLWSAANRYQSHSAEPNNHTAAGKGTSDTDWEEKVSLVSLNTKLPGVSS